MSRSPIAHGTDRGYKKHLYYKEQACEECKAAHREIVLQRARARGRQPSKVVKVTPETIAHGTNRGYNQHRRLNVGMCEPCRKAHTAKNKKYQTSEEAKEVRQKKRAKGLRYGKVQLPLDIFAQLWFSADDRGLMMLDTYFGKYQVDDWIKMNEEAQGGSND